MDSLTKQALTAIFLMTGLSSVRHSTAQSDLQEQMDLFQLYKPLFDPPQNPLLKLIESIEHPLSIPPPLLSSPSSSSSSSSSPESPSFHRSKDQRLVSSQTKQSKLVASRPRPVDTKPHKPHSGRQSRWGKGITAGCQASLRQCSLFSVDIEALHDVYQRSFVSLLQKQRLNYQVNMIKIRNIFIQQFNQFILDPDLALDSESCAGSGQLVKLLNDPTDALPSPDTVEDVVVPELKACEVSEWTAWSLPLAFGVVERKRKILHGGRCCPENLVEQINITRFLDQKIGTEVFENPNNVAENFNNDFLNSEPRDILLIIDTSSSIYVDDFELMKQGIKTMIDLFCGSFGFFPANNRLAILQFSNVPVIIHFFSDPQSPQALKAKVDQMVDFGGKTCTGDALLRAHEAIFRIEKGARPNVPNDTLVVTDGHANCGADLIKSARRLQERSASIYALGVGISSDPAARAQVTSMVMNEDPHHIFSLARYADFKKMIEYIKHRKDGQKCLSIIAQEKHVKNRK